MPSLFEPDRVVVTYTPVEECIEKMDFLLRHEYIRRQIAVAGQKRVHRDHTMDRRACQVDILIQGLLNRGIAIQTIPRTVQSQTTVHPVA